MVLMQWYGRYGSNAVVLVQR